MCIRDRPVTGKIDLDSVEKNNPDMQLGSKFYHNTEISQPCLLYTSDAADERSSVDLGGRRIIKKKNNIYTCALRMIRDNNRYRINIEQ